MAETVAPTSMNRRSFLKTLSSTGALFLAGGAASARSLFLVGTREPGRISNVEWVLYATGRRRPDDQPERRCAIRVTCTDGRQGWADLAGSTMPDHQTARLVRDALLGQDMIRHAGLWRQLHELGVPLGALAAVDIALWDLRGRMEGKPVHALLGTQRQAVTACVRTGFNLGGPQEYAAFARTCKEQGIQSCKVQPYIEWGAGRNGLTNAGFPERDMAVYEAVRDAVGPDYPCIADSSCGYTFDEALRVGQLLDDLTYAWYESPMPENDQWLARYVSLAAQVRTPICAPRTDPGSYPSRVSWLAAKACDIPCMDIYHGGLTACLELASACDAAGVPLVLPDISPDSYPHLQLIGATGESLIRHFELTSPARQTRLLPGRLTPEPVPDEQGHVPIPQTPGMGVELDWKYIFTHRAD